MRMRWLVLIGVIGATVLSLPAVGLAGAPAKDASVAVETEHVGARINRGILPIVHGSAAVFRPLDLQQSLPPSPLVTTTGVRQVKRALARRGSGASATSGARFRVAGHETPAQVGETRYWLALDYTYGSYYPKQFTLEGIGRDIEVWVASEPDVPAPFDPSATQASSGTDFLDGDCRNGRRTEITNAQVSYLIGQFDDTILPRESVAFSVAPARDGTGNLLSEIFGDDASLFDPVGDGRKTVVLVDNVRDDNFYDSDNSQGYPFVGGFFSAQLNAIFDRNVMTVDAFDWLHRTGAKPPDEPVPGDFCASAPARPFGLEGTFAHEYQHLLESYEDPDEAAWVDEGLSDWAMHLTGYVDPAIPITQTGFDSHVQCFLGWRGVQSPANPNPTTEGGPENSLTRWGDQGDTEIGCDYGAAFAMMELLAGRYGQGFLSSLHRGDGNGLAGLQEALLAAGKKKVLAQDVVHDWALMTALDGLIDDGARLKGRPTEKNITVPGLHATINWETPEAYSSPGAPSNGSDYIRLRDGNGAYLQGGEIESLSFKGATTLPPRPLQWIVAPDPPGHAGNPALYSGTGDNRDETIVRRVSVPRGAGVTLTFAARWNLEEAYDFGFVQVSTDGGASYQSVGCTDTTDTNVASDAIAPVVDNLPGITGDSAGWQGETCSLSAYAGQTVLLAFRAINDPANQGTDPSIAPGFWVDDVKVGGAVVSDGSTLAGWQSLTEARPTAVANFVVTIVSMRNDRRDSITVKRLKLDSSFAIRGKSAVQRYVDKKSDFVAAIVTYDDPTETVDQYAPYMLTVNGVLQPGGATSP